MRNLIVCCDGTWNTADQRQDGVPVPTNVIRLYNALADKAKGGVAQIKYYHPGVGTEAGLIDRALGGATGAGLNRNIMSAYQWLCRQYQPQDRMYLFGFSRGAYTVRSLAGLIAHSGLLDLANVAPEEGWKRVERVFQRGYRDRRETRTDWKKDKWQFQSVKGSEDIPIYMVGVWDTVGALGIPNDLALLNLLDASDEHMFHDTTLSPLIEHARHAVALDEIRASFQPTLWIDEHGGDLQQVWFPGVHSDVGGGYRETGLSDGALQWMIDEAAAVGLAFEKNIVAQIVPDFRGVLHDSYKDVFKLMPNQPRSAPRLDVKNADVSSSAAKRRDSPPISDAPYRATLPLLTKGDSRTLTVYAAQPWNETGLYLEQGVTYRFKAEGQWVDGSVACGPEGTNDGHFHPAETAHLIGTAIGELETLFKKATGNREADFRFTKRHDRIDGRRVPWFCLIGAIANGGKANANGQPGDHETFVIGGGCSYKPKQSGYFYTYANDAWNFYRNNRGSVELTVSR
jgi:T6SS, Phospholipase effector Tle1-like, catalytic domain